MRVYLEANDHVRFIDPLSLSGQLEAHGFREEMRPIETALCIRYRHSQTCRGSGGSCSTGAEYTPVSLE